LNPKPAASPRHLSSFAAEYLYGGTLDTNVQSTVSVQNGGRGNLVGSYNSIGTLFLGVYGNWKF
jgi:hypothetical protein